MWSIGPPAEAMPWSKPVGSWRSLCASCNFFLKVLQKSHHQFKIFLRFRFGLFIAIATRGSVHHPSQPRVLVL